MDKDQLIQFLKENLSISLTTTPQDDYYKGIVGYEIQVKLQLGDITISKSSDSIDIK